MKAMQLAAVKKFDLPYADLKRWGKDKLDNYESYIDVIGVILEEMKNETYKFLASKGIKELPVFRGIKLPEKINTDKNNIGSHQLAPLSSFTISKKIADSFSVPHQLGLYPYVLIEYVPINQILSLGPTGLGTFFLYEAVVIGGNNPDNKFFILPEKLSSDEKKKEKQLKKKVNTTAKAVGIYLQLFLNLLFQLFKGRANFYMSFIFQMTKK
ncbi:hypothetical protein JDS99_26510 [Bacillus cereus group sp. N6]|uniref:hypothetical protein n=1 Tax=Bacillus cereus group sp. N6 TaxID=2794583 RepID=UPI0018F3316D|nr:hypothetical protein [Bacillus cereus group sp. N6]MBJ8113127.1 hypothetical protein [Bacillus cereus group sp. N6]